MSDIPDSGSFNLGLANINSQNYGPTATANQQLVGEQTTAARISNANARLQFQLFQHALSHISDFDGQEGPTHDASDDSGVTPTSALPASVGASGAAGPVAKIKSGNAATPESDIGQSASDQALIESSLERQYNVDPAGTPQEQSAIIQAYKYSQLMRLSGNKGLADAADQRVQMLKDQRDMSVISRKNAAALDASQHYDKLAAVEDADEGKAFSTLQAIAPDSAKMILRKNPDATPEELDTIARDTTRHVSGFMHRFTDRPVKVGDDGALYDEKSGLKVDVPIRGVTPERQASLLEQANKPITRMVNGRETVKPQYEWDGYQNPNLWVSDAVAQIRSRNAASSAVEAAGNKAARVPPAQPRPQPGQQPGQPPPGQQPPMKAGIPQPQPGQQPQPQRPPQTAAPGLTPEQSDFIRKGPPMPAEMNTGSSKPNKQEEKVQGDTGDARKKLLDEAATGTEKANNTLTNVKRAQVLLSQNPTLGPGSQAVAALGTVWQNMTGKHAEELINSNPAVFQLLQKELTRDQLNTVLSSLHGDGAQVRLGAQESKLILGAMSANTDLSKGAIAQMLQWEAADAQYEIGKYRTARSWLAAKRDPSQFSGLYEDQFARPARTQTNLGIGDNAGKPKYSDEQVQAYMKKWNIKDEQKARKALGVS